MARLGLVRWSRLACATALSGLLAIACGGESSGDDGTPGSSAGKAGSTGSGGSAGSSGGSKSGSANGGSTSGSGGSSPGSGGSGTASGGDGASGGDDGSGGTSGTGGSAGSSAGSGGEPPDIPIGQMCETFEPCGGDPEGSWTVVDTCLEVPGEIAFLDIAGCEDAVQGVGVLVTGTRSFEDGEVTFEQTSTARVAVIVSDECAAAVLMSANEIDANELCTFLPSLVALNMESPFSDVACAVSAGQCHCDLYLDVETTSTTTTYVVDGSHITQGDGGEYDFCQEDDSLILHTVSESTASDAVEELTVEYERQ